MTTCSLPEHAEWLPHAHHPTRHRVITPKTPSGIALFHHLSFPETYGWPEDWQLGDAIRKIERELPPESDLRINRDGVFMSMGLFLGVVVVLFAAFLWAVWP